jgi:hypothetical protein
MWDWAQRGAIDWQLHVEEGELELELELERQRMRARVLAENVATSGERSTE